MLIVDDSRAQRLVLEAGLRDQDLTIFHASSGAEALDLCAQVDIDLVLSDWMMPGMTGIEFCRALRAMPSDRYVYFILLTSKSDKGAVAEGLDVGADDFLTKPPAADELRARINAGDRVLAMERALRGNNALLTEALDRLRAVHDSLNRDLNEARALQQSLLRDSEHVYDEGRINLLLRSSGHVGGDMVGFFDISPGVTGLYAFDVSGHGVASALLTARLSGSLSSNQPGQNIAIVATPHGPIGRPPAQVAVVLNRMLLTQIDTERYLTLAYAEIDRANGRVRLVQAGHPHPLILHEDGSFTALGDGGLPIGLLDSAHWSGIETTLRPGERLLLVSDGVTECPDPQGIELGQAGLERILRGLAGLQGADLLTALIWELGRWHGNDDFPDDISLALFDYGFGL
ncbi:fused response regulator/phosphatase [Pararhodobacter marinus]|uniref:Fused response regulator/phosphatase n=1 Tax=Pararhodobacter marinus TaxID=2184063 RepID=A0A2U2CIP4_9RHOB|nr:fused response regulator/phosphatase [Pararhodobacter marinus]PWE31765.1 fused response regulator/phosphatase [Pararhodobacter marinus]